MECRTHHPSTLSPETSNHSSTMTTSHLRRQKLLNDLFERKRRSAKWAKSCSDSTATAGHLSADAPAGDSPS